MVKTSLRAIFEELRLLVENAEKSLDAAEAFLRECGFEYLSSGCYSNAYKHDGWGGIVAKISSTHCNVPDLEYHPFLRRFWLKPLFCSEKVMIQPLVDTSDADYAREMILEKLGLSGVSGCECSCTCDCPSSRSSGDPYDLHEGNVGFYRGRAVAFDMIAE